MEKNDFAAIWLAENGNPAIEELAQLNLDVAEKARKAIADDNLSVEELAVSLDINPDEINRWLTGRHTFSVKIINEILDTVASRVTA
ncbi:helix-turn-helix transcriptional regulator [Pedobacter sp. MR2016-24]|uniref:helix-turn-helix transcriptional regulator n=1 Tax=Pedobacter sp. MR2016-24 TaxID=2994466 RepID=UPI002245065F|nr:helix-turn-helix transcriptional regulator [Pedobacter sp. MR2016-24]MCX2484635.1 helix-turn-helix transcriptional regulator [Pedobacter sp. MR2016-24]